MAPSHRLAVRLAILPLLVLTACTPAPRVPGAPVAEAGEPSMYRRACASCHGIDGRGTGPTAAALRTPPADLTLLAGRNGGAFPRDAIVAAITGVRAMPAHGTREMPIWSVRFEPLDAPTAVASIVAQQRIGDRRGDRGSPKIRATLTRQNA